MMPCADHSSGACVSRRRCSVQRTRPGTASGRGYRDDLPSEASATAPSPQRVRLAGRRDAGDRERASFRHFEAVKVGRRGARVRRGLPTCGRSPTESRTPCNNRSCRSRVLVFTWDWEARCVCCSRPCCCLSASLAADRQKRMAKEAHHSPKVRPHAQRRRTPMLVVHQLSPSHPALSRQQDTSTLRHSSRTCRSQRGGRRANRRNPGLRGRSQHSVHGSLARTPVPGLRGADDRQCGR